jgi:GT2 family glycosyltransferase
MPTALRTAGAPAVSVVMPAHNASHYVAAAIDTVLQQSYRDWELIVVDDGSTDGTLDTVRTSSSDPRVRVLHQEQSGVATARNRGLSDAASNVVAFLDADDLWVADHLKWMTAALQTAPDAVLAFGGWRYVDRHGRPLPQVVVPFEADPERARQELSWRNALIPSAVVARTASIRGVGGFDPDLQACADWDLWIRLLPAGRFVALSRVSALYRVHAGSMTENGAELERDRLRLNEKHHGVAGGPATDWPQPRRRAVGHTLFAAGLDRLRERDLAGGSSKIREALAVWPELVEEDEFHFELACAFQQRGLRGTDQGLDLHESAALVRALQPFPGGRASWGRSAFALAWMATVAGDRTSARRYARQALHAPGLRHKVAALGLITRSTLPASVSRRLATS